MASLKISPFAPEELPEMPEIAGIRLASCEAGIRYAGRRDLMLCILPHSTTVAGTFTRSKTASAAVLWCQNKLKQGKAKALVVNSGNANAFTGMRGQAAVEATADITAAVVECPPDEVFVASTGVIGEPLDITAFEQNLGSLASKATGTATEWENAAKAIMTTDTYPKLATRTVGIDGIDITLNAFAKGSGMIAPDMATMLAFIFTDAPVAAPLLQEICSLAVDKSFNSITVDSDTSTSDTVLLFATGTASIPVITADNDPRYALLVSAVSELMLELAQQIVKDGEGASKFVSIEVAGAENVTAARNIAFSIANSPLVKTAIAGEDPNWGRIVMAVGKSGEAADRDRLAIWFGDIRVAENGEISPGYAEEKGAAYMQNREIEICVDVGVGEASAVVWTCDLTHDYIAINADYRS
jgi:glutamate N-acetyltransferase/amino-acid N-acetyltransferase